MRVPGRVRSQRVLRVLPGCTERARNDSMAGADEMIAPELEVNAGRRKRATLVRGFSLILSIAIISGLHYVTDPSHVVLHTVYQHLYYAPVIVAAYWYGVLGGLATAVLTTAVYVPHILGMWAGNLSSMADQYAEIVVFYLIGLTVGLLASSQKRVAARYRDAAASLEAANRELRESHEHLRRADRLSALGQVAAGLAHEIRNPLAGVRGAVEILASRAHAGTPEAEFAEIATRELTRLDDMLTQFLTFARPRDPERSEINLHELLERVAALLRPQADRAGVTIAIERRAALSAIPVDPQLIEQVIFNVLMNSVEVSPAGARVSMREDLEDRFAVIDIIDQGPGIASEIADRIFDPFFTTKEQGTGLGLAISYRIVMAHGGTIEARRATPSGTFMRIRLPLSPSLAVATPRPVTTSV